MIADIAVQFATVFLGAYLAFAAEELRQRRQTRQWAKTHLRQLSSLFSGESQTSHVATGLLDDQIVALDAWLAGRTTEEQWAAVVHIVSARGPDLSSLLRGEPVALLPHGLALELSTVESLGRSLETATDAVRAMRERILPLWADREVPLGEADRRLVGLYRSTVAEYRELIEQAVAAVRSATVQINAWAGAPR